MIKYHDWFDFLKKEINKKFGINDPIFHVQKRLFLLTELEEWLKDCFICDIYWVKYKRIDGNIFELKSFYPDPPANKVDEIIENFFKVLPKSSNLIEKFKLSWVYNGHWKMIFDENEIEGTDFLITADSLYSQKGMEIEIELDWLIQHGYSKISLLEDTKIVNDEIIYHLKVEEGSLEDMVKIGYLNLEYE